MNDRSVTYTVLSVAKSDQLGPSLVTGMIDCHDYDHAEQCFEDEHGDRLILGIYEGDLSHKEANDRYHAEASVRVRNHIRKATNG